MSDTPHDFSQGQGTITLDAQQLWKVDCPDCGWSHLVGTDGAPPIQQCPWCGWTKIAPQKVGCWARFVCSVHGPVTWFSERVVWVDDDEPTMEVDLFCPHCRFKPSRRPRRRG
jgi:hypothetical protein